MKLKSLLVACALVLLPTFFVHAEDGLTQCFDYYKFGSVQVDLIPQNKNALAGTNLIFSGTIKNTNPYPIVSGAVYVKVFRRDAQSNVQANGFELMDQFFAVRDVTIDGQKEVPTSFTWKIPAYAVGGEYMLATYFVTQDKYNLAGLSFTDDITGSLVPFRVTSEQTKAVAFDKTSVTVDGQQFLFAAFNPKVEKDKEIKIDFSLKNNHAIPKSTTVKYTLYSWDGLQNQNIIETKTETLSLKALENKKLSFTVKDNKHPVYYLVVESKTDDAKSVINVRFAREGVEKARLNFPALAQYPLVAGSSSTMFACFHNSGLGNQVDDGKVVLTLTDSLGRRLDSYTYTGAITGSMMAVKKSFTPQKDYQNVTLTAELFVDDTLIETSRTYYECNKLSNEACIVAADQAISASTRIMTYVVIIVALLVLIVAIFAYHGHMKRKDVMTTMVLFIAVLGIGSYQVQSRVAGAYFLSEMVGSYPAFTIPPNSVDGTYTYSANAESQNEVENAPLTIMLSRDVASKGVPVTEYSNGSNRRFLDYVQFKYHYGAQLEYADGTVIPQGTTIPINSRIRFAPTPFSNTHIGWFAFGGIYDSPYAYWNTGTVPQCALQDRYEFDYAESTKPNSGDKIIHYSNYLPIVVNKPSIDIDTTRSTATLERQNDGTYIVRSPGSIVGNVIFAPTTATAYSQNRSNLYLRGTNTWTTGDPIERYGCLQVKEPYRFNLDQKEILLTAVAAGGDENLPPNPPTLTVVGRCQNVPVDARVNPANPMDPNPGDTVNYQYQIDYGTGYSGSQNLTYAQNASYTSFPVTFTTTGVKKIRVRAIDQLGAVSNWVEQTITIGNCTSISAYCYEPTYTNDVPQWTANVSSSNTSITYTYAWNWPSRGYTLSNGNTVLTSNSPIGGNDTWSGPTVVVTPSQGSAQTLNCPSAQGSDRDEPRGGDGPTISCSIIDIESNRPVWSVRSLSNIPSSYNFSWSGLAGSPRASGREFISDAEVPANGSLNGPDVAVRRNSTLLETIACPDASPRPSANLTISSIEGNKVKRVVVPRLGVARVHMSTSRINSCQPGKTKVGGGLAVSAWNPNEDTDDFGGLLGLANYPLDTSQVGEFDLFVDCVAQGGENVPRSSVKLIVTPDTNIEEI